MSLYHIREEANSVFAPASGQNISVGDLVFQSGSYVAAATGATWVTNLDLTSSGVGPYFLGVSQDQYLSTQDAGKLGVATKGIAKATIATATAALPINTKVSFEKATGNGLEAQKVRVTGVPAGDNVIGLTVKPVAVGDTTVEFRFFGNTAQV